MSSTEPTLNSLAASISEASKAITAYLEEAGCPAPSFSEDGLQSYPRDPKLMALRFQLIEATADLHHLALGPGEFTFFKPMLWNHDTMTLDVLNQFDFFSAVPVGGSATYSEIAEKTTLPESIVRRILRHAMTMRLFEEKPPGSGHVVHTSTTAFVSKNPDTRGWIAHHMEDTRPGSVYVPQSLERFSAGKEKPSEDVLQSGFSISDFDRTGRPTPMWDFLKAPQEGKPEGYRADRFSEAMRLIAKNSVHKTEEILTTYDWESLGEATVVDVGGSAGHDAIIIAKNYPKLKFVVQDLPQIEAKFRANLPSDLASRVSFQAHDFFTEQPVIAEVYFLKMILHDWPSNDAISILRNLTTRLKPGARILLCENVVPPAFDEQGKPVLPMTSRRLHSALDLQMLTEFNALERSREQWSDLLKEVDERCEIREVISFPGALLSIIEVVMKD